MRPTARLVLGIGSLIAFGIGPPRAQAQGYAAPPPGTVYYVPRAQAPTYYVQPRTYYVRPQAAPAATYYAPAPRRLGLLRVQKYSNRNSTPYKTILVDPNNPHWTFDPNEWMAHNF